MKRWQLHLGPPGPVLRGRQERTGAPRATESWLLQIISKVMIQTIRTAIPKGRLSKIDDIVPAYVFLGSDEPCYFVGQCLSPEGGDVMP